MVATGTFNFAFEKFSFLQQKNSFCLLRGGSSCVDNSVSKYNLEWTFDG